MKYEFDTDYKKMYLTMFNAATDATNELLRLNIGKASAILISAQAECEKMFMTEYDVEGEVNDE